MVMHFMSDNAATVHPRVWAAMKAADEVDAPYDGDGLSAALDETFEALFGRECSVLWVSSGTAANAIALAAMCPPHGGVVCHREAHIETSECGAPGFYTHGAKLMLAERFQPDFYDHLAGQAMLADNARRVLAFAGGRRIER